MHINSHLAKWSHWYGVQTLRESPLLLKGPFYLCPWSEKKTTHKKTTKIQIPFPSNKKFLNSIFWKEKPNTHKKYTRRHVLAANTDVSNWWLPLLHSWCPKLCAHTSCKQSRNQCRCPVTFIHREENVSSSHLFLHYCFSSDSQDLL